MKQTMSFLLSVSLLLSSAAGQAEVSQNNPDSETQGRLEAAYQQDAVLKDLEVKLQEAQSKLEQTPSKKEIAVYLGISAILIIAAIKGAKASEAALSVDRFESLYLGAGSVGAVVTGAPLGLVSLSALFKVILTEREIAELQEGVADRRAKLALGIRGGQLLMQKR